MSAVRMKGSSALGGMKLEEGNDSLSALTKQGIGIGIGREPFSSTDNPVQLFQFLHAFDNQDLPGWPFFTPIKVPMQKCDKCNREFFSPINHRRHMRVHHRIKKLDKDTSKNRELLRIFWDKLSADEAMDIVALKNASVEDLPGATVTKALASMIRKPGFPPVPHSCIKSGSALLEIVQARPSRFPISSQEFFSILDDASERTFLCGPATSMQKYLFDGEIAKIGLDGKNLVAFTSFLLEQKLIEAWLADKDAEALRCQKLLMEEEEAAQKRQSELLEKKRRKKLRQKEQKAKEHSHDEAELRELFSSVEAISPEETPGHIDVYKSDRQELGPSEIPQSQMSQPPIAEDVDSGCQPGIGSLDLDSNNCRNVEPQSHLSLGVANWLVPVRPRAASNGFYQLKNTSSLKPEFRHKHGIRDLRVAHTVNNKKVWSWKPKPEKDGEDLKFRVQEAIAQVGQNKGHEVLIGSIAVNLGSSCMRERCEDAPFPAGDIIQEAQPPKKSNYVNSKNNNADSIHGSTSQSTVKFWRRRQGVKDSVRESEVGSSSPKVTLNTEEGQGSSSLIDNVGEVPCNFLPLENKHPGSMHFSSEAARNFLSQRWKEAIASDHVKLTLSSEMEPCTGGIQDDTAAADFAKKSVVSNVEGNGPLASPTVKRELRSKSEKGLKKRYIPKQRVNGT